MTRLSLGGDSGDGHDEAVSASKIGKGDWNLTFIECGVGRQACKVNQVVCP